MAMLGGECSACCGGGGGPCDGCNAPSRGAARRFVQRLASLDGTQYTGLSIISREAQDSVFTVQSEGGFAEFEGTTIFQPNPPLSGTVRGYAYASPDHSGCVYGAGEIIVPLGGYFLDSQGSRYRYYLSDDRYPPPPDDGSIVAAVPLFEFRVQFNRWQAALSPNINVYIPATFQGMWNQRTSRPLITSLRFGGESVTAPQWGGVGDPTRRNALFVDGSAILVPSSNCKWRDAAVDPRRVLEVPDSNYRGPLEIDWAIFRSFVAGQDENGDNFAGYALADSGTVTVQWDDMTEFELDEDCNSGACCEVDGSCNIKPQCECDTENGAVFAGVGETCGACVPDCIKVLGDNPPSAIRFRVTAPEERGPPWVSTDYPEGHFQPLRENGYSKVQEMVFDGFDIEFDVPVGGANFAEDSFLNWSILGPVSTQTETSGVLVQPGIGISNNQSYCSVGVRATQRRSGFAPFSGFYGIETKYLEFVVSFGLFGGATVLELSWRSYWMGMGYSVPTQSGSSRNGPYLFEQRRERKTGIQEQVAGATYSTTGNEGFDLIGSGSSSLGGVYEQVEGSGGPFCLIPTWDRTTPAPEVGGTYSYMVGSTSNCRSPFYGTQRRVGSPSIVASATFLSANPLP